MKLKLWANRTSLGQAGSAMALAVGLIAVAHATDVTVPASADFLAAIVLAKTNNIQFTTGSGVHALTFDGSQTVADKVQLATTGALTIVGSHLTAPAGGGAAGAVTIAGTTGASVDITCSAAAVLTNLSDHSKSLDMDVVNIVMNTGAAYASPDLTCNGVTGTALNYSLTGTADTILIGGELLAKAGMVGENYSTANGSGTPVTVRVLYH